MGVPIGEADGDYLVTLECRECGTRYETDETMGNDCPDCGFVSFDFADGGAE